MLTGLFYNCVIRSAYSSSIISKVILIIIAVIVRLAWVDQLGRGYFMWRDLSLYI